MVALGIVAVAVCTVVFAGLVLKLVSFFKKLRKWHRLDDQLNHFPIHWLWGNLLQIQTLKQFFNDSLAFVNNGARAYMFWVGFYRPVVVMAHSDSVKTILRTAEPKARGGAGYDFLASWLGEGLLLTSGKKWERNRRLLNPAFHIDILQHYMQIYNQVTGILMTKLKRSCQDGGFVETSDPVGLAALDIILQCAFSYRDDVQGKGDTHPYVKTVKRMSTLIINRSLNLTHYVQFIYNLSRNGREYTKLVNYVHAFSEEIIKTRKKTLAIEPDQLKKRHLDFLDILLSARDVDGTGLSDSDIRAEVDTFVFEGHDTTASAVSWSLWALAKHPDLQEKVLDDVTRTLGERKAVEWDDLSKFKYLPMFIKECMRLYPSVSLVSRELTKPMVIDGVKVPKGVMVDINIYQNHRNPHIWSEPEVFNPERFDPDQSEARDSYAFVPFSAGPRNCIGQNFALNEIKVMLAQIVRRYKIELDPDRPAVTCIEIVLRSENGIHLKFTPRKTT